MIALAALSPAALTLAALQSTGDTVVAIKNDDPETWVVEYPRVIRPYVEDYRRCLNLADRRMSGVADFELQHRSDIPRCASERAEAVASANRVLDGAKATMSGAEIETLFENIGRIHVLRGRDLDQQFARNLANAARLQEQYAEKRPRGLVIELRDASVVKSRLEIEARDKEKRKLKTEAGNAGY